MSSTYTVSPKSLHDLRDHPQGQALEPHLADARNNYNLNHPITPVDSNLLSPYSSQLRSNTASPDANSYTPAESIYQPSDFSEFDDPFFGANFNDVESSTPGFLDDPSLSIEIPQQFVSPSLPAQNDVGILSGYPISPRKSPPAHTTNSFAKNTQPETTSQAPAVPQSPSEHHRPSATSAGSGQSSPQLTPDTNGGGWSRSSTDSLAPAIPAMDNQSPRVTVSIYGRDGERPVRGVGRDLPTTAESPNTVRGTHSLAGDLAVEHSYDISADVPRTARDHWVPDPTVGRHGLAPGDRTSDEVPSPNEQAARAKINAKNKEIFNWVSKSNASGSDPNNLPPGGSATTYNNPITTPYANEDKIPEGEIPLGNTTENRHLPGQTYYRTDGPGGPITETDFKIMRQLPTWGDAPAIHEIQSGRSQPHTSQAAMERFKHLADNQSMVSRVATWGTRRRSLPSIMDEEGILSGNFLKKLSISNHTRRPSILSRLGSMRRPSVSGSKKRKGSNASDLPPENLNDEEPRRESKDSLAPPSRTSSWGLSAGNKKPTPSLNTALVGMATGAAAIGATHARSGSISATPITSPKSPFGSFSSALNVPPVKNTLRRPRSKTELPKHSNTEGLSHPHLVGMLKKQGGPPVAQLAKSQPVADQDEDEDEDDENFDDADLKPDVSKLEDITPTLEGFRQHVLRLNHWLESLDGQPHPNSYLVDRIAHQLNNRYKQLCQAKVKHLGQVREGKCSSGALCIASGGSALPLDNRGDTRGVDPLSARPDSSDGDTAQLDGGITADSFPQGIPIPPTMSLPAEFECQLCFYNKKFHKPSDWTKHVHEDVQPFTCTWDRCKEPKMFKRKADWVRHENEGHRHLEWWTCDVEDCRHTCFRRDNFLQHLVREHKFAEPKIKTKAAIKKAGGGDRTWQKVEQCHIETNQRPQDEPCRFCGKMFPTWKKLTVHLAKHMEHISLPVLKLVAAKDLDAETVISPVQDPPPRTFGPPPVPIIKQEPPFSNPMSAHSSRASPMDYHDHPTFTSPYQNIPQAQPSLQPPYYPQQAQPFTDMPPHPGSGLMMPQVTTGMNPQPQYQHMSVTTGQYGQPVDAYMNLPSQGSLNQGSFPTQNLEPFPAFSPLGIHDQAGAVTYDNFVDSSMQQQQTVEQYSNHGSVSPYSHSPHQGHGGFYNQ